MKILNDVVFLVVKYLVFKIILGTWEAWTVTVVCNAACRANGSPVPTETRTRVCADDISDAGCITETYDGKTYTDTYTASFECNNTPCQGKKLHNTGWPQKRRHT